MSKKFSETIYGDLTNQKTKKQINVESLLLSSLEGRPKIIKHNFYCNNNKILSLEFSPKIVKGDFDCSNNKLTSLKYSPKVVKKDFNCSNNKLKLLLLMII